MNKRTVLLLAFILLKFILQYTAISPVYDLQRDEYLYLDQANHLAWGYLSVPPLTAWISYLIKLLGNGVFWVKFFPALFGALTMVIVWKAIKALNGSLFAMTLGVTCVLLSALIRLNTLYQPNSLDVLCWTALYYILLKYFNTDKKQWLYIGALVFAIGFLNKYNILFLLFGLLPAILVTKQRKVLAVKSFYFAVIICIVLISPNLLWQYNNGFPVIHHLKELTATQLVNVNRWGFLKTQLFFFLGGSFVIITGLIALIIYGPFKKHRPFFWAFFFTLIVFIYFKAKDYYAIGLYPIYIAFGAVYLEQKLKTGWTIYLRPIAFIIPLALSMPIFNYVLPNKSPDYILGHQSKYKEMGLLRWEDGENHELPQDFADMLGWKELANKVDNAYASLADHNRTIVLCDNYGQAGAINYYTKMGIHAVSFNADYVNWFNFDIQYTNLIRVKDSSEVESELQKTTPYFKSTKIAGSITNKLAREYGTTIFLFKGAKININERIKKEVNEEISDLHQ